MYMMYKYMCMYFKMLKMVFILKVFKPSIRAQGWGGLKRQGTIHKTWKKKSF